MKFKQIVYGTNIVLLLLIKYNSDRKNLPEEK